MVLHLLPRLGLLLLLELLERMVLHLLPRVGHRLFLHLLDLL